ncbi:coiled-coil domain-containing protein 63-like [Clavelina lepadiformis]|uniref:coiled-coil domain-containing protein 63-like n=1 Tax=Clavelina lepadiformis TaxID=159417 RepID=UPI0040421747
MQRAASRRSESSEQEMDGLAEAELAKLQRQYRIMEGDRKAYCEESQNRIRRQRDQIASLQEEREEIQTNLLLARSAQNTKKDSNNVDELHNLLSEQDCYEQMIKEENSSIQALNGEIRSMEQKISQQHRNMGGVHSSHLRHVGTQKQIRVLENRLDKATVEFNKMLTCNAKLREEINHLRSQRAVFDGLHKKLTKELNEQKRMMGEIIEQSTQAYDQRDDAQTKMMALKERNEKDLAQYNMEYKELMRIIDHDAKLKAFMNMKSQERSELEEEEAAKRRAGEEDKAERTAEETMETYQKAFEKIQEVTGEEDIYLLVNRFIQTEDKNFALFNYVNELNNELEIVQEQIDDVRSNIQRFKDEGVQHQAERQNILKGLEEKFKHTTKEADLSDKQLKATEKILDQLKAGIESVFGKISCDRSAISDMLGDNDTVNENNMMQYLGIIEQKTNELLQIHTYLQMKELENRPEGAPGTPPVTATALLGGPAAPPVVAPIQIVPPSTEDDHDDDGADSGEESVDFDRPLTQHELKARVMRSVARKEQTATTSLPGAGGKRAEKQVPALEKTPRQSDVGPKKKVLH